jgi:hypothetical protein
VIAVSGETRERTTTLAQEWRLERLPLAYGLTEDQMRAWGLFISRGINEGEPVGGSGAMHSTTLLVRFHHQR